MSRVVEATCEDGIVSFLGTQIEGVEVLSAGAGQSSGIMIIDGEKAYYVATNAGDLDFTIQYLIDTIEDVASALQTVADTLTAIGTGMTGASTAPPGALPGNVTTINNKIVELNQTKDDLTELKGELA